jgi:hypothetical protein
MGFPLVFGLIEEKTSLQNELWSLQKVPFKNYFFIDFFTKNQTFQKRAQRIANNGLQLPAVQAFTAFYSKLIINF